MFEIEPIKLLVGSHRDIGKTGQGCFMDVVSYLNGDAKITDSSPCVCLLVRPIARWLNDCMPDVDRPRMLPFVIRAMGCATTDAGELKRRALLMVAFAKAMRNIAIANHENAVAEDASDVSRYAANAIDATRAVAHVEGYAVGFYAELGEFVADAAHYARDGADESTRKRIIEMGLALLDAVLPRADAPAGPVIERAARLVELAR